jgi:hypothetical protein
MGNSVAKKTSWDNHINCDGHFCDRHKNLNPESSGGGQPGWELIFLTAIGLTFLRAVILAREGNAANLQPQKPVLPLSLTSHVTLVMFPASGLLIFGERQVRTQVHVLNLCLVWVATF